MDGNDNCSGNYYVPAEKLKELVETCIKVKTSLENSAKLTKKIKVGWETNKEVFNDIVVYEDTETAIELLPPQEGFFFGSTEIDTYYMEDLIYTIETLNQELKNNKSGEFYYNASW